MWLLSSSQLNIIIILSLSFLIRTNYGLIINNNNNINNQPVSSLLQKYAEPIAKLKSITTEQIGSIDVEPYSNDVFYLQYCLEYNDNMDLAQEILKKNLQWRLGTLGQSISTSARNAIIQATTTTATTTTEGVGGNNWKNEPILLSAPHSDKIRQYITSNNCITTTTSRGDLIYCIRAGQIDDVSLMNDVSVEQMKEFFLYVKEVNWLVSLQRSYENDHLLSIITANDLSNVKLIGGSKDFRLALSSSSQESSTLYPYTNGPTLLLNLPTLVNALVKLFTPLFPESVRARLRFEKGPLSKVDNLLQIAKPGNSRDEFLNQIDNLIY